MPDATVVPTLAAYGPAAVVVGAGAGLGAAYARAIAAAGVGVVLIDRDEAAAAEVADSVGDAALAVVIADLSAPDAAQVVLAAASSHDVGLLVANAAVSHIGPFIAQTPEQISAQITVNVSSTTALVHGFAQRFIERGRDRSGIIVMSSQSSRRGAPLVSTYAATKAYLANLAESLWYELASEGIDVLGVLPGSTRTPGWLSSLPQSGAGTAGVMEPADVVAEALSALGAGNPTLIPGEQNRTAEAFLSSMEPADAVRMVGDVMRDTYPDDRQVDPNV